MVLYILKWESLWEVCMFLEYFIREEWWTLRIKKTIRKYGMGESKWVLEHSSSYHLLIGRRIFPPLSMDNIMKKIDLGQCIFIGLLNKLGGTFEWLFSQWNVMQGLEGYFGIHTKRLSYKRKYIIIVLYLLVAGTHAEKHIRKYIVWISEWTLR